MSICFNPERWAKVKYDYSRWWNGKIDRPLIPIILKGKEPRRAMPDTPLLTQATCLDLSISPERIIDRIDFDLENTEFLGDAFPYFNMDVFGPGIVAAFLGARPDNSTGRVWFHPDSVIPIKEIHFEYDADNIWLKRIKEICAAAMARWSGQVLVGMPDLGGVLDILSTFRPADSLLFDLYDYPDEVERLVWEIHVLWHRYYNEINETLMPMNPGYSDWSQLYSSEPSYIPQSDFSYMIGPEMFDRFVKPELEATCSRLGHTIYHLDGTGQLPHLASILEIDELDAVEWQPGVARMNETFPEVYQKISRAGKRIQLSNGLDSLDAASIAIGSLKGLHHRRIVMETSDKEKALMILDKYRYV